MTSPAPEEGLDLTCYVFPGWEPRIRPAPTRRDWMDASPESFAYRCLPLQIANAHGWEILSPCGFEAVWNGGGAVEDVAVHLDRPTSAIDAPLALFGQGTFTFHVPALFRTPPGWSLWVSGPPNAVKDGASPLTGIVETDWSPYSFTMNWRFTRSNHPVRFEENEPMCFVFPVERSAIERFRPRVAPIDEAPEMKRQFEAWSRSRDAFQKHVAAAPPAKPADKWQKLYYRGLTPDGAAASADHRTRVSLCPFSTHANFQASSDS